MPKALYGYFGEDEIGRLRRRIKELETYIETLESELSASRDAEFLEEDLTAAE